MKDGSTDSKPMNAQGDPTARSLRRAEEESSDDSVANEDLRAGSHAKHHFPSSRYVWYVISLLFVVNVFNYMDRMALAILAPLIKVDLEFSDAQLGLLVGFAFAAFYAVCGIPIARWADLGTRRDIIAIALAVWSAMTALTGAAQNFWHLFIARVGVGAGEAGCLAPAQSIICDYVPLKRRAGIFAIHSFGLYAGMMLGMVMAGELAETIGWRWAFVALGLPGIAVAVVVRLTLREPTRGFFDAVNNDGPRLSFAATVSVLWDCKTYRMLVLYVVVNGFVNFGLNQWWPSFYVRVFGLSVSTVGVYLGMALGVGMGIGVLLGGLMANKAAQRDARLPLIICAVATSLAVPVALASLFVSSASDSILLVSLTVLFWSVSHGPVTASMYSVTMPHMRATAGALAISLVSILGLGMGPFCVGVLSDVLAPSVGVEALRYALLAPICLLPVMIIALYAAARALPTDLRAIGAEGEANCLGGRSPNTGCATMVTAPPSGCSEAAAGNGRSVITCRTD